MSFLFPPGENGYCVVATDLPGFGRSQGKIPSPFRGAYLQALVTAEGLEKIVIVAPSMSGQYGRGFRDVFFPCSTPPSPISLRCVRAAVRDERPEQGVWLCADCPVRH